MEVRRIRAGDAAAYRDMRLRALRLAPDAYGTTLDEASARTEADWATFAERSATGDDLVMFVLDRGDGTLAGSTFLQMPGDPLLDADIFQVWLDEDLRGQGWADALLDAAERHACALGATACELWVEDDNARARRFYDRCGYVPAGPTQPSRRGTLELLLRKVLHPSS